MASFNNVTLLGNVGKEPEIREANGKKVAQFSLATKGSGESTDWHNIVAWEKLAEIVQNYVGKGSQVLVSGSITYRSYTNKDGQKVTRAEITARQLQLLDRRERQEAEDDLPI